MTNARTWRWAAFILCGVVRTAHAGSATSTSPSADEAAALLGRVEIAMIGDVERDPVLFERIRSLFPPQTAVVLRDDQKLDQRAVLLPQRPDTVYIWIRVTERAQARVYLALAEPAGQARYLFRELTLESGLDEVGGETLAEVAHSSARALWSGERESSRQALVAALAREEETPRASPAPAPATPIAPASSATPPGDSSAGRAAKTERRDPSALRLGMGASGMTHSSGAEGWLSEMGAFLTFEFRGRFSLRTAVHYLVPTDFELPPARVHLNGASAELRAGWLSNDATRIRVRLEAGFGVLFGRAQATIVDDQPKAHALAAQNFERGYALAAAGFEWPLGPAWIAAGADVRIPLRTTSYEVGSRGGTSAALCPGGSLEVGIGFDPVPR